jgi:hypothetical protein
LRTKRGEGGREGETGKDTERIMWEGEGVRWVCYVYNSTRKTHSQTNH